tara:strand:+ start:891 stop:1055 length:165 start_codon:yes stop_codon:yes gene_type:complete
MNIQLLLGSCVFTFVMAVHCCESMQLIFARYSSFVPESIAELSGQATVSTCWFR